jgi:hypothetical protein
VEWGWKKDLSECTFLSDFGFGNVHVLHVEKIKLNQKKTWIVDTKSHTSFSLVHSLLFCGKDLDSFNQSSAICLV